MLRLANQFSASRRLWIFQYQHGITRGTMLNSLSAKWVEEIGRVKP
jgi:hypothetical protein